MTRFAETNCVIERQDLPLLQDVKFYAKCEAPGCTWVGAWRNTVERAKRDAIKHHESD